MQLISYCFGSQDLKCIIDIIVVITDLWVYSKNNALLVADKVQEAMTVEEKQKLYAAIGYQESRADAIYPKEVDFFSLLSDVFETAVTASLRRSHGIW